MQLIILIMVNILIASIFYLIISLKLERSATEFRSKKLRKEMEELINEFNHTAERNLSLLEYKINILRELLKKADALPTLDITINDDEKIAGAKKTKKRSSQKIEDNDSALHPNKMSMQSVNFETPYDSKKQTVRESNNNTLLYLQKEANSSFQENKSQLPTVKEQLAEIGKIIFYRLRQYIENKSAKKANNSINQYVEDLSNTAILDYDEPQEQFRGNSDMAISTAFDENELMALYRNADDKYLMIAKLYSQGCSLQLLSKISGIPVGEISLILNLSMKK
ncbi:MAG: hypothetical protein N3F66_01605 [Spirochaetes bacterium]|nr:hypothetical protein [Spirochaetota bacterium]